LAAAVPSSAWRRRWRRQRGIALVAALWFLILLSVLAASYAAATRGDIRLAGNAVATAAAQALADAAIHRVIAAMAAAGNTAPYRLDGTPYAWAFGDGQVRFIIEDESGKIDINEAEPETLAALFQVAGADARQARTLAEGIAVFRGSLQPADEAAAVEDAGGQRNSNAFVLVDELIQVPGMTGDLFERVAPLVTVYTASPEPNRTVSSPEVLSVLQWLESRSGGGITTGAGQRVAAGRSDRRQRLADAVQGLQQATGRGGDGGPSVLEEGAEEPTFGQGVYTIHAEGMSGSGAVYVREAVVRISAEESPPYGMLAWRQGPRWLFPVQRRWLE
jgi:general secretion pathway protein K